MQDAVERYSAVFGSLETALERSLEGFEAQQFRKRVTALTNAGLEREFAVEAAAMPLRPVGVELQMLISGTSTSAEEALGAYMKLGDTLKLDRLRHDALNGVDTASYWERLATRRLVEDLRRHQAQATADALVAGGVDTWLKERDGDRRALVQQLNALSSANASFAQFTLAADAVRGFMSGSEKGD